MQTRIEHTRELSTLETTARYQVNLLSRVPVEKMWYVWRNAGNIASSRFSMRTVRSLKTRRVAAAHVRFKHHSRRIT